MILKLEAPYRNQGCCWQKKADQLAAQSIDTSQKYSVCEAKTKQNKTHKGKKGGENGQST